MRPLWTLGGAPSSLRDGRLDKQGEGNERFHADDGRRRGAGAGGGDGRGGAGRPGAAGGRTRDRRGARRQYSPASAVDRAADHRRGKQERARGRRVHGPAGARRGLRQRAHGADQGRSGGLRHDRRRRAGHAGRLFHVRREAVRPGRMVVAAARGQDRRPARRGQGDRRARRGQPEGAGDGVPGNAEGVSRCQGEAAGEHRAGRGRRGGNRLTQFRPDRPGAGGDGGAEEDIGRVHPVQRPERRRQRQRQPRRQGRHRAADDRRRRDLGPLPQGRYPFVEPRADRESGVAAGQGARHAGQGGRLHAGDRRLVRAGEAADRAAETTGGRTCRARQRGGCEEGLGRRRPVDRQRGLSHQHRTADEPADGQHPGAGQRLYRAGR